MRNNVPNDVGVANYVEVETPILIDSSLPAIPAFVVLFGVQRWMVKIPLQKFYLLEKRFAYLRRGVFESFLRLV